ncbi:EscT/YscT/HrcT family type III secretion system export apparatus protein [Burkholderia ubonensis]|uniref:type III secretion system export apparatus subunit SctT n=1 Tax=Burkholderia ubonensis TaxID=101571 RepID=UPI00075C4D10|nr:type III secretion system export apparatus subunit SctT [Burkholderia ubonensis]KVP02866.1 type III secretion system protein SpaR [Burkholderia ubonensis]OJB42338.1 EscT/YscT/HrcT family type III secretion system export apparatus protein [Burkholderia ubonensis]OJB46140.1 EscT/YscT/HrcT family type III secretion system export apparatus protein [Burkholderia ubonensis]
MAFGLFFEIHGWIAVASLGFARVAPVFFILPFLNSNVLNGVVRTSVTMVVAVGLWPHPVDALPSFQTLPFLLMIAREVGVGVLLACLLVWPFWVFHALGSVIDNQRGATLSSSIDPANGVDTSELANLFNLFAATVYLQGGGMTLMLDVMSRSYQLCDPLGACAPTLLPLLGLTNQIIAKALVLASPVVAALLLSEVVLGLLSRFAPQMNAFSVSLTVKSAIALLIMLIYFSPVIPDRVAQLAFPASALPAWLQGEGR